MNGKIDNLKILAILTRIVEQYPYLRFRQILNILNLDVDKFYEESYVTLEKLENKIKEIKI